MCAAGEAVTVRPVQRGDVEPYRRAVGMSRERLARWNPVDPDDIVRHLTAQSDVHRTFLVLANDPAGEHGIVGKINVTNVVRGRFQSASLGYDSYDPYAGRRLFREGLGLVVGVAFTAADRGGMGLHRVEASVQPGNVASAGVLRSLGFRREGFTPRMLRLGGPDGREDWRDHERFAITADEWPAQPYAPQERRRLVVLVNGLPGSGKTTLASVLADDLGLPLLSGACEPTWALLSRCPAGAVVECEVRPQSLESVRAELHGIGDPGSVVELCGDDVAPLGLGTVLRVDTSAPLSRGAVVRLALAARAAATA